MDANLTTAKQHTEVLRRDAEDRAGQGTQLVAVTHTERGSKPTRTFLVTFTYKGGRQRTFDGKAWVE